MGACVSTPEGCGRCRLNSSEKIKLRRKGKANTTVKRRSVPPCRDDKFDGHASAAPPLCLPSFTNPLLKEILRSHGLTQLQNLSLISMKILKVFQMMSHL